jgi:hypothetical protein
MGIKKKSSGRVKIKNSRTFQEATSLTSFLITSEYRKMKIKNIRNGIKVTTPIRSKIFILTPKICTENSIGN